ncbi:MAG TPA: VOC family protein [Chitinophagaceae bacterium]|nr:VOC family protein [Chitinophagaceae bacterium]
MKTLLAVCLLIAVGIGSFLLQSTLPMKKPVLNHIALYVTDLKKSAAFYQDIIGIDTIPEPFHDGKHTWFRVSDQSQLHLIEGATEPVKHPKNTHLCFSVPSVEEFIKVLDKAGIVYSNWPGTSKSPTVRADGIKQIYFQDPDGYWLEINDDYK